MKTYNRNFNLMIVGQIISLFGASILRFVLSLYILDLTGSGTIFGILLAISTIPTIFLSPIGGAIADRLNRKKLMVYFDFSSSVIVGVFGIFLYMGKSSVVGVGILMTALMVISCMYQPTVQASIPLLVEDESLLKANGIVSGVSAVTNFLGPVLGGLFYSVLGLKTIVVISGVSFFVSAIMEIFIQIPYEKREQTASMFHTILGDIKEGLVYIVKENKFLLKAMSIACALNLFLTPIFVVGLPYLIKITLKMDNKFYGFAQGGISLSVIVAALVIGSLSKYLKIKAAPLLLIGSGVFIIPMALAVGGNVEINTMVRYLVLTISAVIIMFLMTLINIFLITMLQKQTPTNLLGKVMAILIAVSTCAMPLGQVLFGALLDGFVKHLLIFFVVMAVINIFIGIITQYLLKKEIMQEAAQ